jgi:hypothetical protein
MTAKLPEFCCLKNDMVWSLLTAQQGVVLSNCQGVSFAAAVL